jgi:benzoyl-CoA reductase/2-hydroxyglutaryl-CoA dehydratase subunit BcrC/BadD/HgdB
MDPGSVFKRSRRSTKAADELLRPLVRQWNEELLHAHERGKYVAWSMLGIPIELLDFFGFEIGWPENYGTVCAAHGKILDYMESAELDGYAEELCAYMKNICGYLKTCGELGGIPADAPRHGLPYPDALIATTNYCDPRVKIFETLRSRYINVPTFVCDIQSPYIGVDVHDERVKEHFVSYNYHELLRLVKFLEDVTHKKLDLAELAEIIKISYQVRKRFYEVHEFRKAVPCPMPSEDIFACIVPQLYYHTRRESLDFVNRLYEEVKDRVDHKIGVISDEKYRLVWIGLPSWFNMGIFNYLEDKGAVCVWETNYYVSDPIEVDLSDPLRALVERMWIRSLRGHAEGGKEIFPTMPAYDTRYSPIPMELLIKQLVDYKADGAVMHRTVTCRAVSFGQIFTRRLIEERLGLPVLQFESDMADLRRWSDHEIKANIDTFIELLADRKSG